jgi:hypothetical protein
VSNIVTRYVANRYMTGYEGITAGATVASATTSVSIAGATTSGADRIVLAVCAHLIDATGFQGSTSWSSDDADVINEALYAWANDTTDAGGGLSIGNGQLNSAGASGTFTSTLASASAQTTCSLSLFGTQLIELYDQTTNAGTDNVTCTAPTYGGGFYMLLFVESSGVLDTPAGGWTKIFELTAANCPVLTIFAADADTFTDDTPTLTLSATGRLATLTGTLGAMTSAATATVALAATLTASFGAMTSAATATVANNATLSGTLGAMTLSATMAAGAANLTLDATLGAMTSVATATVLNEAELTASFGDMTSVATATVANNAALTGTLGAMTSVATATNLVAATLAATLGEMTSSAQATVALAAVVNATLAPMTSAATATVLNVATLNATLGAMTLAGSIGIVPLEATLTGTFAPMTAAATATALVSAQLAATLGEMTSSAQSTVLTHAEVAASFAPMTALAEADVLVTAQLARTFGAMTLAGVAINGGAALIGYPVSVQCTSPAPTAALSPGLSVSKS